MTGATCITAMAKNTSAERFMRSEQGAAHSDVAVQRKGRTQKKKAKEKTTPQVWRLTIVSKHG